MNHKVTNQMVTACRSYITDNGTCLIWDQDAEDIMSKMQVKMTPIWIISLVSLSRLDYNTHWHQHVAVFINILSLAGLYLLVSGVSVLFPEDKETSYGKTWKEVLWGFRDADFLQVWGLLQATRKGIMQDPIFNPTLTMRPCQVTIRIIFSRSHK